MDRLDAMLVLSAVADAGSLSGAGRALGIPLTTISRKITDLEAHVGAQLLDRSARKVSLTDAGRAFVMACKAILKDVEGAERSAAGEYQAPRGTLTVGVPAAFGRLLLLPVLSDFMRAYPEVDVRMVLTERAADLPQDSLDVSVRIGGGGVAGLVPVSLGAVRTVVCGSPRYFAHRGSPAHPRDLSAHDCVTIAEPIAQITWKFQTAAGDLMIPIRTRLSVTSVEAAIDAAIAGVGLTRVCSYVVQNHQRDGLLEIVLPEFEPNPELVELVHRSSARLPLKLCALMDFAAPRLRERLAAVSQDQPSRVAPSCKDTGAASSPGGALPP